MDGDLLGEALRLRRWLANNGFPVRALSLVNRGELGPYVAHERERVRVLSSPEAERVLGERRPTV